MRRVSLSIVVVLMWAPGATSAQWLHYPTPDVPRTADGKPDWTAGEREVLAADAWEVKHYSARA
jgi:hypothetical protein